MRCAPQGFHQRVAAGVVGGRFLHGEERYVPRNSKSGYTSSYKTTRVVCRVRVPGDAGAGGTHEWIDGCFSDDVDGFPQDESPAGARMGYTPEQTNALQVSHGLHLQSLWRTSAAAVC